MKKIDAHQHFWKFDPKRDNWIDEEMKMIQRDFLPQDLGPLLVHHGFEGCIAVQSDQSEAENIFHLELAKNFDFIKGIVGWVDLKKKNIEERLAYYSQFSKMKGFRHVLQGEIKRDMMLDKEFLYGIKHLGRYNFTYDILILQDQLEYVPSLVARFSDQAFVIDHMAKPNIKERKIEEWKRKISKVAQFENIYCKISGLVTEAAWNNWKKDEFIPYMDVVVAAFGMSRIMFGSDWPVCLTAASFEEVVEIVENYFAGFSKDEQANTFALNAIRFYNL
ncbi:MAG: amidohydrolase family protein [Flavisolibacter sp.]